MTSLKKNLHYSSIEDLPIWNWYKLNKTNDLKYLMKDFDSDIDKSKLLNVREHINDEFIDAFGVPDSMRQILDIQKEITLQNIELVLNDDQTAKTFIKALMIDLESIINQENTDGYMKVKRIITKDIGQFDDKKMSVLEYYSFLKEIEENER